ncbi:MAG: winged helix-turn-helix transcriptional regulator [Candidatus Aureabacteria bacterium]|nr:winged helix-turn-helix transcriptional regulator [Candidatus Auribacterota bacterium]
MTLKALRQILKALGEDTRLRILNLLFHNELSVNKIGSILNISQPSVSKHLVRLRLLGIVSDKRAGNLIYYRVNDKMQSDALKTVRFIFSEFENMEAFQKDLGKLKDYKTA